MLLLLATAFAGVAAGGVAAGVAAGGAAVFNLHTLDDPEALCLDGSPAAFYYGKPATPSTKWMIWGEGKAWCLSEESCVARAKATDGRGGWHASGWPTKPGCLPKTLPWGNAPCLGSTIPVRPPEKGVPGQAWGCQLSNDCDLNPAFCDFNMVHLKTCDGGSWSGNRSSLSPSGLHYKGKRILDATAKALLQMGIADATEIVIGGGSAGALGVYLQSDYWLKILKQGGAKPTKTAAVADCGFFQDWRNNSYHDGFVWMASEAGMQSATAVDPACAAAHPTELNLCLMAEHISPFIQTNFFALQAKFDSWQKGSICGKDCGTAAGEQAYGDALVAKVKATILKKPANGAFVDACLHHCGGSLNYTNDHLDQASALKTWYKKGSAALPENGRLISTAKYPCAACCSGKQPQQPQRQPQRIKTDDGLARTPPMGWSSWYAFGADINETNIVEIADAIVALGLAPHYNYVNLDDAWMSPMRTRFGELQGDLDRFPSGMKWLADQMHRRKLKLGLYGCAGVRTCLGYPGQFEHEYQDARTIAEWGIDWWKHDNCWQKWATVDLYANQLFNSTLPNSTAQVQGYLNSLSYGLNVRGLSTEGEDAMPINWQNISGLPLATPESSPALTPDRRYGPKPGGALDRTPRGHQIQRPEAYRLFGEALRATGRNITYSICPLIAGCDASVWSYYKQYAHTSMNQCPQKDNTDTWESFLYHIDDNNRFPERAAIAGPGYWNDMDFLMVGYKELKKWEPRQSAAEYRSQFSLFAVLAAPLVFSADIRGTAAFNKPTVNGTDKSEDIRSILGNAGVIAVSQDALGKQGRLAHQYASAEVELYVRQLEGGALALAVLNRGSGAATKLKVRWADAGVPAGKRVVAVRDLWASRALTPDADGVVLDVASHDTRMLHLELAKA